MMLLIAALTVMSSSYAYGPHRDLHSFLHDALPICMKADDVLADDVHIGRPVTPVRIALVGESNPGDVVGQGVEPDIHRSEEHTSELQSPDHLVCRLLLEKKKANPLPGTASM